MRERRSVVVVKIRGQAWSLEWEEEGRSMVISSKIDVVGRGCKVEKLL